MTDADWEQVKAHMPKAAKRGRKVAVDLREVLNAIHYLARAGVG